MAGKRKLFLAHAGELAYLLVRAVGPGGLVTGFVQSYAERHDRDLLLNHPPNLHEIESTIGREVLLVMTAEVRRLVPRALASGPSATLRPEEASFSQAFFAEFLASLSRAMAESLQEAAVEAETFQRDLEMYDRWSARRFSRGVLSGSDGALESPFPDRCALLLDPSLMEQARRASAEFENELAVAAAKIFDHLGRDAIRRPAAAPRGRRPARRKKAKSRVKRAGKKRGTTRSRKAPPSRRRRAPRRRRRR